MVKLAKNACLTARFSEELAESSSWSSVSVSWLYPLPAPSAEHALLPLFVPTPRHQFWITYAASLRNSCRRLDWSPKQCHAKRVSISRVHADLLTQKTYHDQRRLRTTPQHLPPVAKKKNKCTQMKWRHDPVARLHGTYAHIGMHIGFLMDCIGIGIGCHVNLALRIERRVKKCSRIHRMLTTASQLSTPEQRTSSTHRSFHQ